MYAIRSYYVVQVAFNFFHHCSQVNISKNISAINHHDQNSQSYSSFSVVLNHHDVQRTLSQVTRMKKRLRRGKESCMRHVPETPSASSIKIILFSLNKEVCSKTGLSFASICDLFLKSDAFNSNNSDFVSFAKT